MEVKDNKIERKNTIKCGDKLIQLDGLKIMGILNVTPDSFFPNSRMSNSEQLLDKARTMIQAGADFIDVGGFSTRPGASFISEEVELKRVIPSIETLRQAYNDIIISVDTFRSEVARQAIEAGANIINDVFSGRMDDRIFDIAAEYDVPYILTHSRGDAKTMQSLTLYEDVVADVCKELSVKVSILKEKGVKDIILDPGFGFAKTMEQNYELLNNLELLHVLNCPIIIGVSRKGMIYKKLNITPEEALNGTTAINTVGAMKGASILRVHDVLEAKQIATLLNDNLLK
ncbi:MAG: dihydropteroate synthase [Brumimicrobium sp.]